MITPLLAAQIVLLLFVFVALLSAAAGMVYFERKVAALLLSDYCDYIVGATIFVDGGMTLFPGFATNG